MISKDWFSVQALPVRSANHTCGPDSWDRIYRMSMRSDCRMSLRDPEGKSDGRQTSPVFTKNRQKKNGVRGNFRQLGVPIRVHFRKGMEPSNSDVFVRNHGTI